MSATPRNTARLFAVSAMAAAAVFTGGAAGFVASAEPAAVEAPFTGQDVWVDWKVYSTYEKCRQEGRDMIGVGAVVDYRCSFDSPGWLLELRMVG